MISRGHGGADSSTLEGRAGASRGLWSGGVGVGEVGAADGALEEHGAGGLAEAGEELLELLGVVPAVQAHLVAELVEGFWMGGQFAVADFAYEACPAMTDE